MIVFDLDDTLYKEQQYVDSGIHAVAVGADTENVMPEAEAFALIKNAPNVASGFDQLESKANSAAISFDVNRMLEIYRYHIPNISLSEDTQMVLNTLVLRHLAVGIITDGRSETQRAKISSLGLNKYVSSENIIISSEIGADKTQATPFQLMMKRNPAEETFVYIGDNPAKDFYWPNKLGWQTIMLRDTLHVNIHSQHFTDTMIREKQYLPSKIISSIDEILTLI